MRRTHSVETCGNVYFMRCFSVDDKADALGASTDIIKNEVNKILLTVNLQKI